MAAPTCDASECAPPAAPEMNPPGPRLAPATGSKTRSDKPAPKARTSPAGDPISSRLPTTQPARFIPSYK